MNKMRLFPIFAVLMIFLAVIMAACAPEVEREPALEVMTAVATRTAIQTAVLTHISTPISTKTPIPSPTQTIAPSATPTPTSTSMPTPIPTPKVFDSYTSPSGEWVATLEEGFFFDEPDSYLFRVVSASGEIEWVAEHIIPDERGSFSVVYPNPVAWSSDGQFMYFTHSGFGDGCGPFVMGRDLHQLDLDTGHVTEIVAKGYWFALSPDGQRIAYLSRDRGMVIQDLSTGEEIESQLDISSVYEHIDLSDLTWSPDNNALLVLGAIDLCVVPPCPTCNEYVIVRIDADNLEQRTIVEGDTSLRRIMSWAEPDKVWLYVEGGNYAWLNPETGEITPADE